MALININQFAQTPVRGQLDLQITKSGVISGRISANQMSSLKAGDPVKLDATITAGFLPQFVAAGQDDDAIGYLAFDVKKATFVALDDCEVAFLGGPVMWMVAESTIAPGAAVEQNVDGNVQTLSTHKQRGIALDPGVASQLLRVIITNSKL